MRKDQPERPRHFSLPASAFMERREAAVTLIVDACVAFEFGQHIARHAIQYLDRIWEKLPPSPSRPLSRSDELASLACVLVSTKIVGRAIPQLDELAGQVSRRFITPASFAPISGPARGTRNGPAS